MFLGDNVKVTFTVQLIPGTISGAPFPSEVFKGALLPRPPPLYPWTTSALWTQYDVDMIDVVCSSADAAPHRARRIMTSSRPHSLTRLLQVVITIVGGLP